MNNLKYEAIFSSSQFPKLGTIRNNRTEDTRWKLCDLRVEENIRYEVWSKLDTNREALLMSNTRLRLPTGHSLIASIPRFIVLCIPQGKDPYDHTTIATAEKVDGKWIHCSEPGATVLQYYDPIDHQFKTV